MDIINFSKNYFNGFNELFAQHSSVSQRAVGFLKTVSYATVVFPLFFGMMYGAAIGIEKLKGRVTHNSTNGDQNDKIERVSNRSLSGKSSGSKPAVDPSNTESMWSNPEQVFQQYAKLVSENSSEASNFIKRVDGNGNTVFHALAAGRQNIQKNTLQLIKQNPSLYRECVVEIKNNEGKSALDIAIERGQMGIITDVFPISGESEFKIESEEEREHLKETISELIKILASPEDRARLYESCPGELEYDKLNHILSAIHAVICSGFEEAFLTALTQLNDEQKAELPHELLLFTNLSQEQMREEYKTLRDECTTLTSSQAVSDKMDEWELEPRVLTPSGYLSFVQFKRKHGQQTLKALVLSSLTGDSENSRNTHMNALLDLFNPYRSYDQWLDFNDENFTFSENGEPILHSILKGEAFSSENLKRIIQIFILKNPDFLKARDRDGNDFLAYLEMEHTELKEDVDAIMKRLPLELFKIRVKKSLKYFLEEKGREMAMGQ